MKIAIIHFTDATQECEIFLAVKRTNMVPIPFLWNESPAKLYDCDGYIIADDSHRYGGVIAEPDPVLQVIREQSELGKPMLGISNGARILVESGLVPGVEDHKVVIMLNDNTPEYNATTGAYMRLTDEYQYNAFTRHLKSQQILRVPYAHSQSQFIIPPALLLEMQANGLNVFQYCDEKGVANGLINNIAAVSNKNGNVMAMMPRLELIPEGDAIFTSMREYLVEGYRQHARPLAYYPRSLHKV